MRAIIIEDEFPAAERLQQLLVPHPEVQVLAVLDSVAAAVAYLQHEPAPELIFSDIQLGDGLSFAIYEQVPPPCPLIFTTSYDEYALRAFGLHSLDYLLKPIKPAELARALHKYALWRHQPIPTQQQDLNDQLRRLASLVDQLPQGGPAARGAYRKRFLVESGEQLVPVPVQEVAYCYTANELVYLMRTDGRRFVLATKLEDLAAELDPQYFFRLNRQYIAQASAIQKIVHALGGRLKLTLHPAPTGEVIVSRDKAQPLKQWLEQAQVA